jgi:hypothetical protein
MAKRKIQEKKKKAREQATYKQKVKSRLFASRKARADRAEALAERAERGKLQPFRKQTHMEQASEHVQHNLQVLRALEEEYCKAQLMRNEVNAELEAAGHVTIEEKMEALRKKAVAMTESIQKQIADAQDVECETLESVV